MSGTIIFVSGPIGAGKSTLGRGLAEQLAGVFLDGDDFSHPDLPWYSCILQTSRSIVQAGTAAVERFEVAVVAYPLRRTDWVYFKRSFEDRGMKTVFISLRAAYSSIVDPKRGRTFSNEERARIQVMIAEGYGARPFSDLIIDTDLGSFSETLAILERDVRRIVER
ncbi:hypothetical protein [Methylobacterium phyllostachyos]|nr:hypothetical protein [Methylobacterium phyllostachyos]